MASSMLHINDVLANPKLQEQFIKENSSLVSVIACKHLNKGVEYDDLFQLGSIGLLKAMKRFDSSYETEFSTYAVPMINGEIHMFLRDYNTSGIKISRESRAIVNKYNYFKSVGLEDKEICKKLSISMKKLKHAKESIPHCVSLEETISSENTNGDSIIHLAERISVNYDLQEETIERIVYEEKLEILKKLIPEESYIIATLRMEDMSQYEIAAVVNKSQMTVGRTLMKIKKLAESIDKYYCGELTYKQLCKDVRLYFKDIRRYKTNKEGVAC